MSHHLPTAAPAPASPTAWRAARVLMALTGLATLGMGLGLGSPWAQGGDTWSQAQTHKDPDRLPAANLLIEWRWESASTTATATSTAPGGWSLSSHAPAPPGRSHAGGWSSGAGGDASVPRHVVVRNGAHARVALTQEDERQDWTYAIAGLSPTPPTSLGSGTVAPVLGGHGTHGQGSANWPSRGLQQASAGTPARRGTPTSPNAAASSASAVASTAPSLQALPQTHVRKLGDVVEFTPRWPGGVAPVNLLLHVQLRRPAASNDAPDLATQDLDVSTTLDLPLGLWTVVAEAAATNRPAAASGQHSANLSTRDLDHVDAPVLQVRVLLP